MKKIPDSVKDHISNAQYYLEAADLLPRKKEAIRILLLLTSWENVRIAEEELHSWVQQIEPAKKLYRSHAYKFRDIRQSKSIDRIILGPPGTPAQTISYSSAAQFERLLEFCRYGGRSGTKKLESIFEKGWHSDAFQRHLVSKIGWESMMVGIYEELPGYGE